MSLTSSQLTLRLDGGETLVGEWSLLGEILHVIIGGKDFRIDSRGDLESTLRHYLATNAERLFGDRAHLIACMTCKHFSMSSMGRDMGRGQRGTCTLLQQGVEICFLCEKYLSNELHEQSGT